MAREVRGVLRRAGADLSTLGDVKEPRNLARVLFSAAGLPKGDTLAMAARFRFDRICAALDDDTHEIARVLGVSVRQVQRLRVAFGSARSTR